MASESSVSIPIPRPFAGETENGFIIRAHRALERAIPDTDQRNSAIYQAWRAARGEGELEQKARLRFADDSFAHARDVPVFAEHNYVDRQGREQSYDLEALLAVCDRCNYRIADTGNFAALSEGHTPTVEQSQAGAKVPPMLGFAGPYRIGMIGNRRPRWAIFQDEHYFRDDIDKVRRLPTRSPEVWLKDSMAERFMDPIALLGAETPRLDMGIRFARCESGEEVEKYTACLAGANTSFVPALSGEKTPVRYRETSSSGAGTHEEESDMAMDQEDIKEIVDAFMATDAMQWVKTKMEAEASQPGVPAAPVAPAAAAPTVPAPAEPVASALPAAPPTGGAAGQPTSPQAVPASETPEQEPEKERDKYALLDEKARYARMEQENTVLKERVSRIEADSRKKERYSKLRELRNTHAFDLNRETTRCQGMSDEQFVDHLTCIVENYQRIPVGASLYVPQQIEDLQEAREVEQYQLAVKNEAMRVVEAERSKGNHGYTYEAARQAAHEKLGNRTRAVV